MEKKKKKEVKSFETGTRGRPFSLSDSLIRELLILEEDAFSSPAFHQQFHHEGMFTRV